MAALPSIENIRYRPKNVTLGKYRTTFQEVLLPAGTLLFKGTRRDISGFFLVSDLIGNFIPDKGFCLTPITNLFTFPYPTLSFGIMDWKTNKPAWMRFDTVMIYVLKSTCKFISMISPSQAVRGTPLSSMDASDIIRRCDKFPEYLRQCIRPPMSEKELLSEAAFDNCLNPLTGTEYIGHISIGNQDSLDADKKVGGRKITIPASETSMGKYLNSIDPDYQSFLLRNLYIDFNGSRGFPEIVLRPRKDLKTTLFRTGTGLEDGIKILLKDLDEDTLNLLPMGYITENGFVNAEEMFNKSMPENMSASASAPASSFDDIEVAIRRKQNIEKFCQEYLSGKIGGNKFHYDMRTGFYVLDDFWPGSTWYRSFLTSPSFTGIERNDKFIFKRPPSIPRLSGFSATIRNTRKNRLAKLNR